jgi:predicted O-methyltransferase YrrM
MITEDRLAIEPEYGTILKDLVIESKPNVIVEIGTGKGFSTSFLLRGVNQNNRGTVYTFDSVIRKPYAWKEMGVNDSRLRKFNTEFSFSRNNLPKKIDFVFHDAGHFFEHVREDLYFVLPRISDKGIVCVHDIIYSYDMGEKVKKMFGDLGWNYQEKREGCGMGIARK